MLPRLTIAISGSCTGWEKVRRYVWFVPPSNWMSSQFGGALGTSGLMYGAVGFQKLVPHPVWPPQNCPFDPFGLTAVIVTLTGGPLGSVIVPVAVPPPTLIDVQST